VGLFRYRCENCGVVLSLIQSPHQEQHLQAECTECGGQAKRVWDSVRSIIDFREGYDVALDKTFATQRERDEYLARHSDEVRRVRG